MNNYECYCKPTENIVEKFGGHGGGGGWRGGGGRGGGGWRGGGWRGGGGGRYRHPFYSGNGYYNFYPPADSWTIVPYNNVCGCQTSTIPNPEIIYGSIRGGVNVYQCEPGSDIQTCYCKDTCNGNPDITSNSNWWNCSSPSIGGQGVPYNSSCNM